MFSLDFKLAMDHEHFSRFKKENLKMYFASNIMSKMQYNGVSTLNPYKTYLEYIKADFIHKDYFMMVNFAKYAISLCKLKVIKK